MLLKIFLSIQCSHMQGHKCIIEYRFLTQLFYYITKDTDQKQPFWTASAKRLKCPFGVLLHNRWLALPPLPEAFTGLIDWPS